MILPPPPKLSIPCKTCQQPVMVSMSLAGPAKRHGVYCPDCMPSRQVDGRQEWTPEQYQDYLKTDHWRVFRRQALDYYGRKCYLCGCTGIPLDIHHNTYERLGGEKISDVIPLCRDCHQGYEDWKRGGTL